MLPDRPDNLGILGGLGPLATADFMAKMIRLTPAAGDDDHIPALVCSYPQMPSRAAAIVGDGDSPLPALLQRRVFLEASGVRCIVMPCNTAHNWYEQIIEGSRIPFLHIVDSVRVELERVGIGGGTIGYLSTEGTMAAKLYERRLEGLGYSCLAPSEELMESCVKPGIALVKGGREAEAEAPLRKAAQELLDRGAQRVILACTEIPVGLASCVDWTQENCIDSSEALARAAVRWAMTARAS